ncbi:MAG: LPS export ABC transporter periplasmic protein LptC [Gammaproteobacteria bacterium]
MSRRLLLLLPLAILIIALVFYPRKEQATQYARTSADGADYWLEQVDITSFDAMGQVKYLVQASRLSHQRDSGEHQVLAPNMHLQAEQSTRWQVNADQAVISPDGKRMDFSGNVALDRSGEAPPKATSTPGPQSPLEDGDLTLLTDKLTVYPEQGRLETDAPVEIRTPTSETHAVGMRAFSDSERLQLLSHVRSRQLPPQ